MDLKIIPHKNTGNKFVLSQNRVIGLMEQERFVSRDSFNEVQKKAVNMFEKKEKK
jgi:hypothetical protein